MKVQIGLIVALLLIAGCNANPGPTNTPPSEPPIVTAEATAATSSSANNSGMTTYVDTRSGVAFDYPSGWKMVAPPADEALIYSYSVASYNLTDPSAPNNNSESGLPPGHTKIEVTFYSADETPDSMRRTVQADVDSGMAIIVKEETRTAADGSPAYYYHIQGRLGGTAQVVYTSINGHTVSVAAYGEGANFEAVAKSLRAG